MESMLERESTMDAHDSTTPAALDDAAMESTDDAVLTASRDNVILSWSGGAARLLGYRAHEVIGKNIAFLFPEKHREIDALNARDAVSGMAVRNSVLKAQAKNGDIISLIYSLLPIRDRAGRVSGILRVCKDVSAFKTAAVQMRRALQQMRRMDRVQDRVLDAVGGEEASGWLVPAAYLAEDQRSEREFLNILAEEVRAIDEMVHEIEGMLRARMERK